MKKVLSCLIVLAMLPFTSAWAVKVASLYQAEIPVASQSDMDKAQAVKAGLLQILTKLCGDPQVEKNPTIKGGLKQADHYVEEFSYVSPALIQIHYDPTAVNELLQRAGVAYWGESRPLILVWLALTGLQQPAEIIGNESPGEVLSGMKQLGKQDGLPLIFPMMDMTDISQVSVSDVSGMTLTTLKAAAKRYAPDALLVGNMQQAASGFSSQWRLVLNEQTWDFMVSGVDANAVMTNVLAQISKTLAQYYVVKADNTKTIWVKLDVANITQRDDLAQLTKYLQQLTQVQQVQLTQVSGDGVQLSVLVRGSMASFQSNASIGQHLLLKSQDQTNNKISYDWVR